MMNFYKTPKLDALNEKFNEFENRFQLKLDEQNTAHKIHIQKLDDKIARLEEENSRTFELIDKLYEYRFKEIHDTIAKLSEQMSGKLNHYINIYDNKLENTFITLQKVMLLTKEKITVIKDKVEICMNDVKNFEEQINTLTKQQEATNETLVALNNTVSELDDKIDLDVCELYEKIDETINKEIEVHKNIKKLEKNLHDKIYKNNWSDCYDIKLIIQVTAFNITKKIELIETKFQTKVDLLEQENKSLYKLVEKLSETNTQNEMEKNDKNSFINKLSYKEEEINRNLLINEEIEIQYKNELQMLEDTYYQYYNIN